MAKKKSLQSPSHSNSDNSLMNDPAERFRPLVPLEEQAAYEAALNLPIPTAIRMNPRKSHNTTADSLQARYDWKLEQVPFCDTGYRIANSPSINPGKTSEHRCGAFYIQDSASMLPVSLFDPLKLQGSPLILDMAASPGGKTTHLISASDDRGMILANDGSASRITALKKVLKNWGSINHAVTNFPGERFGDWFPNTFDAILLDAPCSMQGLVSSDTHPIRPITEREEKALAARQLQLLESALKALKPGGQLVYSTCTLSPLEDEAVVDALLRCYPEIVQIENAQHRLPFPAPGIVSDGINTFDPALVNTVRLWPHRYQTAGFYTALLSKTGETAPSKQIAPTRDWKKSGFRSLSTKEAAAIAAALEPVFGFDLRSNDHQLAMRDMELWELPGTNFAPWMMSLPLKSVGMRVAIQTSGGWIPDFNWVSLNFARILHNRYRLESELTQCWLEGHDLRIDLPGLEKGTILYIVDEYDVPLGVGFVSSGRIRNLNK